jgi:hypothetical protein
MDGHRNFILQNGSERRTVKERQGRRTVKHNLTLWPAGITLRCGLCVMMCGWGAGEGWVEREAVRSLGLVMVPGKHSIKVELQR